MKEFLAFLVFLVSSDLSSAAFATSSIDLETIYAEFLDARGAVEALDAGVVSDVDGHGTGSWRHGLLSTEAKRRWSRGITAIGIPRPAGPAPLWGLLPCASP